MDSPAWHRPGTRSIDKRYLARPPHLHVRPYFRQVSDLVLDAPRTDDISLLDVGSANGAFCHYMLRRMPDLECVGLDLDHELVEYAARWVSDARFIAGDIRCKKTLPTRRFSVVTMLTLHSHFDHVDDWLQNAITLVEPGGLLVLFGLFNPDPVDVLIRLRYASKHAACDELLPGWNILSRANFVGALDQLGAAYSFKEYVPDPSPPTSSNDPLQTRSLRIGSETLLTNGACLLLPFAILEVRP